MSRLRRTVAAHPVLVGMAISAVTWVVGVLVGFAPPEGVEVTGLLDAAGRLLVAIAAMGAPGAFVTGYLTATRSVLGRLVRGYGAAVGGGVLAFVLVFVVYQVGVGAVPALQQGSPGAAAYSLFLVGFLLGVFGVLVVVGSLAAAPAALLGARTRAHLAD